MKTLRLVLVCGLLIGMASCGGPGQRQDTNDTPPLSDSIGQDTATWGDTTDTTMRTDSLGSPSLP
ncbi:hypothetical protein [Parapedobacter defluvii]|uniref:hypothetical protein n=1 Tax=Parapedobacter defluvii TaxID=2045106 RepID=UPI00166B8BDA|nr:hypothetical protein [Parapedobacter defluvii]